MSNWHGGKVQKEGTQTNNSMQTTGRKYLVKKRQVKVRKETLTWTYSNS